MTEGEDSFILNLSNEYRPSDHKREKLSKRERVRKKRDARKADELLSQKLKSADNESKHVKSSAETSPDASPAKSAKPAQRKATKRPRTEDEDDNDRYPSKKYKPALFYNNPDIPKLQNAEVETVHEDVFSGDSFQEFNLHEFMVSNLETSLSITQATSVQKATIPHMLEGKDVLVKSQTGSGKTLAYAIPIVQLLQEMKPKIQRTDGTLALVVVPTRELALQSHAAFQKLVKPFTWVVPGCLMGGESKKREKARLRKGLNVVVSSPGRLVDHIENTRNLELGRIQWLVIDEADRLLDMGFEKEVSQVVHALRERGPKDRKTALLSATLNKGVERLAGMSLQSPVTVDLTIASLSVAPVSGKVGNFAVPENLKHHCVVIPSKLRLVSLAAFILWKCKMAAKRSKMLVFMSTQDAVDFHFRLFNNTLFEVDEEQKEQSNSLLYRLHGDMPQKERTQVFSQFSKAESGVLFCTDVAARGLDLPQVRWIVQYMSPGSSTDYIHRVGRTARIGSRGNALLFLMPSESGYTKLLADNNIKLIEVEMNHILQTLLMEKDKLDYLWADNEMPHTVQEAASLLQIRFTDHVQDDMKSRTLARKAYQSFIGAYAAYPSSVKHIFHVKGLHLGHVATSFGLQEAPTKIGNIVGTQLKPQSATRNRFGTADRKGPLPSSMHKTNASEFSRGLSAKKISDSIRFTKKEKRKMKGNKFK